MSFKSFVESQNRVSNPNPANQGFTPSFKTGVDTGIGNKDFPIEKPTQPIQEEYKKTMPGFDKNIPKIQASDALIESFDKPLRDMYSALLPNEATTKVLPFLKPFSYKNYLDNVAPVHDAIVEQAQKDHPNITLAGNIAGGLVSFIPLTGFSIGAKFAMPGLIKGFTSAKLPAFISEVTKHLTAGATTFAIQNAASQIASGEINLESVAKSAGTGAAIGILNAGIPQPFTRTMALSTFGYASTILEGGDQRDAITNGSIFALFGLMNTKNLSGMYKLRAANNFEKTIHNELLGDKDFLSKSPAEQKQTFEGVHKLVEDAYKNQYIGTNDFDNFKKVVSGKIHKYLSGSVIEENAVSPAPNQPTATTKNVPAMRQPKPKTVREIFEDYKKRNVTVADEPSSKEELDNVEKSIKVNPKVADQILENQSGHNSDIIVKAAKAKQLQMSEKIGEYTKDDIKAVQDIIDNAHTQRDPYFKAKQDLKDNLNSGKITELQFDDAMSKIATAEKLTQGSQAEPVRNGVRPEEPQTVDEITKAFQNAFPEQSGGEGYKPEGFARPAIFESKKSYQKAFSDFYGKNKVEILQELVNGLNPYTKIIEDFNLGKINQEQYQRKMKSISDRPISPVSDTIRRRFFAIFNKKGVMRSYDANTTSQEEINVNKWDTTAAILHDVKRLMVEGKLTAEDIGFKGNIDNYIDFSENMRSISESRLKTDSRLEQIEYMQERNKIEDDLSDVYFTPKEQAQELAVKLIPNSSRSLRSAANKIVSYALNSTASPFERNVLKMVLDIKANQTPISDKANFVIKNSKGQDITITGKTLNDTYDAFKKRMQRNIDKVPELIEAKNEVDGIVNEASDIAERGSIKVGDLIPSKNNVLEFIKDTIYRDIPTVNIYAEVSADFKKYINKIESGKTLASEAYKRFKEIRSGIQSLNNQTQNDILTAAMQGDPASLAKFSVKDQEAIKYTRKIIDNYSNSIANSGDISKELREKILRETGAYLKRSYQVFTDPKYQPSPEDLKNMADWYKQKYPNVVKELSDKQVYEILQTEIDSCKQSSNPELFGSRKIKSPTGSFKQRKNLPEVYRKFLGENNIEKTIDNTILTLSRMTATHDFYNSMFDVKGAWSDKMVDVQRLNLNPKPLPDSSEIYGKMAGKFVNKNIYQDLLNAGSLQDTSRINPYLNFVDKFITGPWKVVVTAFNVPTQVRNPLNNVAFSFLSSGSNPLNVGDVKAISKAFWALSYNKMKDSPFGKFYKEFGDEVKASEFKRELIENAHLKGDKLSVESSAVKSWFRDAIEDPKNFTEKTIKYGTAAPRLAMDIYSGADDLAKATEYIKLKNEGVPVPEISWRIDRYFQQYKYIPKNVKLLSKVPFINPFLSYLSDSLRIFTNLTVDGVLEAVGYNPYQVFVKGKWLQGVPDFGKLARLGIYHYGLTAIIKSGQAKSGLTDEDKKYLDLTDNAYSKYNSKYYYRNKDGYLKYLDISYMDPLGNPRQFYEIFKNEGPTALAKAVTDNLTSSPLKDFGNALQGKDKYGKNLEWRIDEEGNTKKGASIRKALLVMAPGIAGIPIIVEKDGFIYVTQGIGGQEFEKLVDAWNGQTTKMGTRRFFPEEIKCYLTGLKTQRVYPKVKKIIYMKSIMYQFNEVQKSALNEMMNIKNNNLPYEIKNEQENQVKADVMSARKVLQNKFRNIIKMRKLEPDENNDTIDKMEKNVLNSSENIFNENGGINLEEIKKSISTIIGSLDEDYSKDDFSEKGGIDNGTAEQQY